MGRQSRPTDASSHFQCAKAAWDCLVRYRSRRHKMSASRGGFPRPKVIRPSAPERTVNYHGGGDVAVTDDSLSGAARMVHSPSQDSMRQSRSIRYGHPAAILSSSPDGHSSTAFSSTPPDLDGIDSISSATKSYARGATLCFSTRRPHAYSSARRDPTQRPLAYKLDSGAERQLTNLPSGFDVRDFDLSPDGHEVVLERVQDLSDIALLDLMRP